MVLFEASTMVELSFLPYWIRLSSNKLYIKGRLTVTLFEPSESFFLYGEIRKANSSVESKDSYDLVPDTTSTSPWNPSTTFGGSQIDLFCFIVICIIWSLLIDLRVLRRRIILSFFGKSVLWPAQILYQFFNFWDVKYARRRYNIHPSSSSSYTTATIVDSLINSIPESSD